MELLIILLVVVFFTFYLFRPITKKEEDNFERRFTFYYDYPAEVQLLNVKSEAHDIIFERITQDIFNASLAKW